SFSLVLTFPTLRSSDLALSLSASACAIARPMYSSVMGWMVSFTTIFNTCAVEGIASVQCRMRHRNTIRCVKENLIAWDSLDGTRSEEHTSELQSPDHIV